MHTITKSIFFLLCFFTLFSVSKNVKSQKADSVFSKLEDFGDFLLYRNHDTSFIINYGNNLAVKLVTVNKYNYFRVRDGNHKTRLRYRPIRDVSTGVGVSYKWFALDITFALGLRNKSEFEKDDR